MRIFLFFLLTLALLNFVFSDVMSFDVPLLYQARDIHRAISIFFEHRLIWYGPDLSGGGHLPGPFYYWLLGLPFYVIKKFQMFYYLEFALAAGAVCILYNYLKTKFSELSAVLFFAVFMGSQFFYDNLADFWNPSFVFLFLAAAFVLLEFPQKTLRFVCGSLILSLAVQIHFLSLMLVLAAIIHIFFQKVATLQKLKYLLFLFLPMLVCFLPFLLNFQPVASNDLGSGIMIFFRHVLHASNSKEKLFFYFWREFCLLPLLLVLAKTRIRHFKNMQWLVTCVICALPGFLWLGFHIYLNRYAIPFFIFGSMLAAVVTARQLNEQAKLKWWLFTAIGLRLICALPFSMEGLQNYERLLLVAIGVILFLLTKKKLAAASVLLLFWGLHYKNADRDNLRFGFSGAISVAESFDLIHTLKKHSPWDYRQFQEHTYLSGIDREKDLSVVYKLITDKNFENYQTPPGVPPYDGLFISRKNQEQILASPLREAFANKVIQCVAEDETENFHLCFYNFMNSQPLRWNNVGRAYQPPETPTKIETGSNSHVFYLNDCHNQNPACEIFISLKLLPDSKLFILVEGEPLSGSDNAVNTAWTLSLKNPQLIVECQPGVTASHLISSSLGFEEFRNTMLAPFENIIELGCKKPISISLDINNGKSTFKNYIIETRQQTESLVWTLE